MKYQLLHATSFDPSEIAGMLANESIETTTIRAPDDLVVGDRPTILVLDPAARQLFPAPKLRSFVDGGGALVVLRTEGDDGSPKGIPEHLMSALIRTPYHQRELLIALRTALRDAATRTENTRLRKSAQARTQELDELTQIGVALNTERDYDTLQSLVLSQARRITSSDAGSLYLVETAEDGTQRLRFKLSQTHSRPNLPLSEFTIAIDHTSIAGYVASTGEPLVIDDAYFLPPDVEYSINRSFDKANRYRTKSMLTIPMSNHKNEVIGVLQLINRKRDLEAVLEASEDFDAQVTPYSRRTVELVTGLAGQAAVSIENSQLYDSIERLFEGFVTAAVTAIEQRDPTTFGHSGRVATMTVGIAKATDCIDTGPFKDLAFSREQLREIQYAGLLHDFGKVGVREQVLIKSKKLYPPDLSLIKQRYAFVRRTTERNFYKQRAEYLEQHGTQGYEAFFERMRKEYEDNITSLDHFLSLVLESNEPTILPDGSFDDLLQYADRYYQDSEDKDQPFLTSDEVRYLTIRKGSLDETERVEIESHVNHTYRFLMQIPWTNELQDIPRIAYGHHEKLDGRGYPRGVKGDDIPIQTRMMTIADIFDALTASDRPYKRAVPAESALDILASEVKSGMLDADLFQIFHEARVFDETADSPTT
jgi:HD-GYP domain-containing protein (c-di-GMP phosphodiesterase class II)